MGTAEVERLLGKPPDRIVAACFPTLEMWIFEGNRDHMTSFIRFDGGRVSEVVRAGKRIAPAAPPISQGCGTLPTAPPGF